MRTLLGSIVRTVSGRLHCVRGRNKRNLANGGQFTFIAAMKRLSNGMSTITRVRLDGQEAEGRSFGQESGRQRNNDSFNEF